MNIEECNQDFNFNKRQDFVQLNIFVRLLITGIDTMAGSELGERQHRH